MRSFDTTRERPAPAFYDGLTLLGEPVRGTFSRRTLVIAAKADCLGCQAALESPVGAFGATDVLIVGRVSTDEPWWHRSAHPVIVSPSLLEALDVRWPPFYVLIDGERGVVLREGVVFGPDQVAAEVAPLL